MKIKMKMKMKMKIKTNHNKMNKINNITKINSRVMNDIYHVMHYNGHVTVTQ